MIIIRNKKKKTFTKNMQKSFEILINLFITIRTFLSCYSVQLIIGSVPVLAPGLAVDPRFL